MLVVKPRFGLPGKEAREPENGPEEGGWGILWDMKERASKGEHVTCHTFLSCSCFWGFSTLLFPLAFSPTTTFGGCIGQEELAQEATQPTLGQSLTPARFPHPGHSSQIQVLPHCAMEVHWASWTTRMACLTRWL